MYACPRPGCGGSVGVFAWHDTCSLCARTVPPARRPTAKERGDHRLLKGNLADYTVGIYNPNLTLAEIMAWSTHP